MSQNRGKFFNDGDDHLNGRCNYANDEHAHYPVGARTLSGGTPIGKARAWICPVRPRASRAPGSRDNAAERYYCPTCDWCDYYCLCGVRAAGDRRKARLMAERREREVGLYGFGRPGGTATSAAFNQETSSGGEEESAPVDDGTTLSGRLARRMGGASRRDEQGRGLAVDEAGDGQARSVLGRALQTVQARKAAARDGSRSAGEGCGGPRRLCVDERARHPRKQTLEPREDFSQWSDRDLAAFGLAFDVGAMSAADEAELEARPERWPKRCCVWIRRDLEAVDGGLPTWYQEPFPDDADVFDRWAISVRNAHRRGDEHDPSRCSLCDGGDDEDEESSEDEHASWRTPVGGTVYGRTLTAAPRPDRRLTAEEEALWRERAQEAIDEEERQRSFAEAEEEERLRRAETIRRAEEEKAWNRADRRNQMKRNKEEKERRRMTFGPLPVTVRERLANRGAPELMEEDGSSPKKKQKSVVEEGGGGEKKTKE